MIRRPNVSAKPRRQPRALLLGWVSIEPKQAYQLKSLSQLGYQVIAVTNDQLGRSSEVTAQLADNLKVTATGHGKVTKLLFITRLLMSRSQHDIALIPCASRMSAVIVILCRLRGIRTIVIEWGDISIIDSRSWLMRWNMRWSYVLASSVWFKEPYMKKLLDGFHARKPYFLPNAVESPPTVSGLNWYKRDIDFVWVNRVVPTRYPLWLVEGTRRIGGSARPSTVIMGLLPREQCDAESWNAQQCLMEYQDQSLRILPYGEPTNTYARSRFFVLAADYVFGNNALLEAMAAGVVPLVSASPDVNRIVVDGHNGLIFQKTQVGLQEALYRALALSPEDWLKMSESARLTVKEHFGVESWRDSMEQLLKGEPSP